MRGLEPVTLRFATAALTGKFYFVSVDFERKCVLRGTNLSAIASYWADDGRLESLNISPNPIQLSVITVWSWLWYTLTDLATEKYSSDCFFNVKKAAQDYEQMQWLDMEWALSWPPI